MRNQVLKALLKTIFPNNIFKTTYQTSKLIDIIEKLKFPRI